MDVNPNILSPFVTLNAGESEAIAMSLEWPADLLTMDDSSGRAMALNLKIRITGTLGVLLKAKRDGQIHSLEPEMERLVQDLERLQSMAVILEFSHGSR